ncbi:hypothetical protein Vretimale_11270 [Volvox reticuliferus]|uniref:Uncharacterized protein n=1 Tax=Volvox reticuliferus TaxID=1737510 RepID=A0A8J4CIN4_9CHLO|nr:hypothetical protein Vretifemale_12082 [Volvox reticuliferus]GIM07185.1 hypothetical protein Vretimale_11270 [Volvox reticuliferus]
MLQLQRHRCAANAQQTFSRLNVKLHAAGGLIATRPLVLHAGDTTMTVPFTTEGAHQLQEAFQKLFQTFAEKQKAQRPKRWDMMEWRHTSEDIGIEVFCNPNAYTTAFDAKLLITLGSRGGLTVTTEARLSAIASDLDNYLQG